MIVVSEQTIERIRLSRHRQRTLYEPVCYGEMGELKRCRYKPGNPYTLHPASRYDEYKTAAREQPTRAKAVVYLLARYDYLVKPLTITVLRVVRSGDHWLVAFDLGDKTAHNDTPVYLSPSGSGGDYTTTPSRALDKVEVMTPLVKDLEDARRKAREGRVNPQRQLVQKMQADADTLRRALMDMKTRNRLRRVEHDLKAIALALPAPQVLDSPATIAGDELHADVARHERPPVSRDARDSRDADADVSRGVEAA